MAKHRSFRLTRREPQAGPKLVDEHGNRLISYHGMRALKELDLEWSISALAIATVGLRLAQAPLPISIAFSGLIVLIGAYRFWKWGRFADEVWDHGDHLIVKRGTQTQRIDLQDIERLSLKHRDLAWLHFRLVISEAGPFGREILFSPAGFGILQTLWRRPTHYDELMHRILAARRERASLTDASHRG